MNNKFAIVDIETTGNSPKNGDRIIQIAIVVMENETIVDQFSTFINPNMNIPPFIEQLTGISNDLIKDAPTFEQVSEHIFSLLKGAYFVAHNVFFDLSFIKEEFKRLKYPNLLNPIIDTVELSRIVFPTIRSYKLQDLANSLKIKHKNPHRADSDAYVTARIFQNILKKLNGLPIETLTHLEKLSPRFISDVEEIIRQLAEKKRHIHKKRQNEITVYRNLAIKRMTPKAKSNHQLTYDKSFSSFYQRFHKSEPSDVTFDILANKVYEAFETNQHALIEVDRGIEKTRTYFFSAIYYALFNHQKVTIATSSLFLMDQIKNEIIPYFDKLFDKTIDIVTLKGSQNYLSLDQFEKVLREDDKRYDMILTKAQILVWLLETETGDVDELNLSSGGMLLWDRLHVNLKNKRYKRDFWKEYCFYERALIRAKNAHIVLTNHAMLMANSNREESVFADSQYVIIDEAHLVETSFSQFVGMKLEYSHIHLHLQRLQEHLNILKNVHKTNHFEDTSFQSSQKLLQELHEQVNELFSILHSFVNKKNDKQHMTIFRYRLQVDQEKGKAWSAILELVRKTNILINDFVHMMYKQYRLFERISNDLTVTHKETFNDYFNYLDFLSELQNQLKQLFFHSTTEEVTWIEIETKGAKNAVTIYSQPIFVSTLLADQFFSRKNSVVLISNSLTVSGKFDYCIERLGLNDFYPMTIQLNSLLGNVNKPQLFVPNDLPFIQKVKPEKYASEITNHIFKIANELNGKTVVLFSSYELLRNTYEKLKDLLVDKDFFIFGQGINSGSPSKVMKSFQQFEEGVFLSTINFWNMIEYPIENIHNIIIAQLPFYSPDDPIVSANCERLTQLGKSSFYHYSLPEAVKRIKQGLAQLSPLSKQFVTLFVFDKRIIQANYGDYFLHSIQVDGVVEQSINDLILKANKQSVEAE